MSNQFCQSCSMPLVNESQLGTEADGSLNKEYCTYCYQDGVFTNPDCTLEEMIELCVPHVMEGGMSEADARQLMERTLPMLKRWSADQEPLPVLEPVRYERMPALTLHSLTTKRTSNKQEMSDKGVIPQAWQEIMTVSTGSSVDTENSGASTPSEAQDLYAVYHQYENEIWGDYDFTIGVRAQYEHVGQSESNVSLPEAEYAVFLTRSGPMTEVVIEAWQGIWRWQAEAGCQRTYSGDFELYRADKVVNGSGEVEIFIAVNRG